MQKIKTQPSPSRQQIPLFEHDNFFQWIPSHHHEALLKETIISFQGKNRQSHQLLNERFKRDKKWNCNMGMIHPWENNIPAKPNTLVANNFFVGKDIMAAIFYEIKIENLQKYT